MVKLEISYFGKRTSLTGIMYNIQQGHDLLHVAFLKSHTNQPKQGNRRYQTSPAVRSHKPLRSRS